MTSLKLMLTRLNGWALSLLLHGGVAALAALSVFSAQMGGGNGNGSGGRSGSGAMAETYGATVHSGEEPTVSGTVLPDTPQYGRLSPEETPLESVAEELPLQSVPFDVFAVGASEPTAPPAPSLADPLLARPGSGEGRAAKLPAASGDGEQDSDGATGPNGSGDSDGLGHGEGTGEGNATGVYTPAPAYPSEARRRNIEGSVLVELVIASDGSCAVRRVVESSGFSPLDDAVQKTVSYWKYKPASADGRPETTTRRMRFTFRLGS